MTLQDGQARVVAALETTFGGAPWEPSGAPPRRAPVSVAPHAGRVNADEIKRMAAGTGSRVLVTVAGREDRDAGESGARVLVYALQRTDRRRPSGETELVDAVETTLRALPGSGRAPLRTRAANLYSDAAGAIGATLWAVSASWPDLAAAEAGGDGDAQADAGDGAPTIYESFTAAIAPALDQALGTTDLVADERLALRGETEAQRRLLDWGEPRAGHVTLASGRGALPSARVTHETATAFDWRGQRITAPHVAEYVDPDNGLAYRVRVRTLEWVAVVRICDDQRALARLDACIAALPDAWEQWGQGHNIELTGDATYGERYDESVGCLAAEVRLRTRGMVAIGPRVQMVDYLTQITCNAARRPT